MNEKIEKKLPRMHPCDGNLKNSTYAVEQYNVVIMDILGGCSKELDQVMRKLTAKKGKDAESSHFKHFEYGTNI